MAVAAEVAVPPGRPGPAGFVAQLEVDMTFRHAIDGFVMDAIAFDADQLDGILAYLNEPESEWRRSSERRAQRAEVLAALLRLVRSGSVSVWVPNPTGDDFVECGEGVWPDGPMGELYFDLTGRGMVRYLNWDS